MKNKLHYRYCYDPVVKQYDVYDDHLYFENSAIDLQQQIVTPNQYGNTINYVSVKISGNKIRKFCSG
jgi:hypothetical protein